MLPFEKLIHSKSVWILFIFLTSTTFGFLEEFRRHDVERRSVRGSRSSLERLAGEMPFQRDTRRQADEKDRVYENLYDRRSFRTGTDRRVRNEDRVSRFRNYNTDIRSDRLDQNWNDQRRMIESRDFRTRETDRIIPTRTSSNERSRDVRLNRDQRARSLDNRQERLFRDERRTRDMQENELQRERREDRFSGKVMVNVRENQRRSLNNGEERLFRENPSRNNRQRGYFMRQSRTRNARHRDAQENYDTLGENRDQYIVRGMSSSTERINRQRRLQEREGDDQIRSQRDQNRERLLERREESFRVARHERNLVNSERRVESREMERENRDNSRTNRERSIQTYVRYNRDNKRNEYMQPRALNRRQDERTPETTRNVRLSLNRSTGLFRNTRDKNTEQRVSRNNRDSNELSNERGNLNRVDRLVRSSVINFRTIRDRNLEQRGYSNERVFIERSMERGNRVARSVRSSLNRDNRSNNHRSMRLLDANMNEIKTNRERDINIRSGDRSDFYRERNVRNHRASLSRENIRGRYTDSSRFARESDEIRYRNEDTYSRNYNVPSRSVRDLTVRASLSRSDSAEQARQARFNSEVSRQETSTCISAQRNTERQTASQRNIRQNEATMRKLTDRTSENVAVSRSRNSIEKRSVPIIEFVSNSGRTVEELKDVQYSKQNFKFDHLANVIQVILGVYLIGQILAHSSKKKSSGFYKMLPSLSAIKEKLE